jgi:hypothetical protein
MSQLRRSAEPHAALLRCRQSILGAPGDHPPFFVRDHRHNAHVRRFAFGMSAATKSTPAFSKPNRKCASRDRRSSFAMTSLAPWRRHALMASPSTSARPSSGLCKKTILRRSSIACQRASSGSRNPSSRTPSRRARPSWRFSISFQLEATLCGSSSPARQTHGRPRACPALTQSCSRSSAECEPRG